MNKYTHLKKYEDEEFRDVFGYEEHYLVSNYGRVFSKKYNQQKGNIKELKQMRHYDKKRGYRYFRVELKSKCTLVHRIVISSFIGENKEKQVNHKDGDVTNNKLSNLEYISQSQNIRHAFDNGLYKRAKISKKVAALIFLEIKESISRGIPIGKSITNSSNKFSVTRAICSHIWYRGDWCCK